MDFFNLKQPRGTNKYPQETAVYSKYTAVYSRVYGRILKYWSLEYVAVYPESPKWGVFKHNIDHHNWQLEVFPNPQLVNSLVRFLDILLPGCVRCSWYS